MSYVHRIAFFHPFCQQAENQMNQRLLQRARHYAGYKHTMRFTDAVEYPLIPREYLDELIKWRQSGPAWPCPDTTISFTEDATVGEDEDEWKHIPPSLRLGIKLFEYDAMYWGEARLNETNWACAHFEEVREAFFAAGGTLPLELVPEPAPPPRKKILQMVERWHPEDMSTQDDPSYTDPSRVGVNRSWAYKAYIVVDPGLPHHNIGPIVCRSNVRWWIRPPSSELPLTRPANGRLEAHL